MSRPLTRRPRISFPRLPLWAVIVLTVAAVLVVAMILITALLGAGGSVEMHSDSGRGDVATFGGAVAPSDGGGLRAPEETMPGAAPAPAYGDKGEAGNALGYDSAATQGAGGGEPGVPLPTIDAGRTIIRSGQIELEVKAVADAFEQVRQIATALGGYVGDSTFTGTGDRQSAYLTMRVPSARFGDAIAQIRALDGEVQSISTSAQDVTEEYRDVEATLRNLRAVEERYVDLLGRASSIGDILQVQDRLNQVRLEIDRTEARRQLLASQTDLATISVSLRPAGAGGSVVDDPGGPLGAAADAWDASLATLSAIATAVLVVAVYSWWIVPPLVVLAIVVRRAWLRRAPAALPDASD